MSRHEGVPNIVVMWEYIHKCKNPSSILLYNLKKDFETLKLQAVNYIKQNANSLHLSAFLLAETSSTDEIWEYELMSPVAS